MSETKCEVCQNNLILDEENVCAQCELSKDIDKNIENESNVNCGTCKIIVEEDSEGLYCDVCNRWYHNACSENPLPELFYGLLNEAPDNVKWFCDKCIWETEKWITSLKGVVNNNEESDTDFTDQDLSDIEIENNVNVRKRDRLNDDDNSFKTVLEYDHKYDHTKEPEIIIHESRSIDSKDYEERKITKKVKRNGSKRKIKQNNNRNACDMCSKRFIKTEELVAHKLLHVGDEKPFKCTDCDSTFVLKSTLKIHSITHDEGTPCFCDICDKSFKFKSAYLRHLKNIHSDAKLQQCSLCGFRAKNTFRLEAHLRKHANLKLFEFTECDLSGKTVNILKTHMITNSSAKPLECLESDESFKKALLGAWPFECSICGAKFPEESGFVIHARMHTGKRQIQYACTICDTKFSQQSALNRHMLIHPGTKPFECDICGRTFRKTQSLKTHKLIHTGEKPLKCEICGKSFLWPGSLSKHMLYHEKNKHTSVVSANGKRYECEQCGNKYKTLISLNKHKSGIQGSCQGANGTGNSVKHTGLVKKTQKEQKLNQHHNQEPTSSIQNITPGAPQGYQTPVPPLLYAGSTNNYTQYNQMLMNATSAQWNQNTKFWNSQ